MSQIEQKANAVQAAPVAGLNLDDLVSAQETGLKATRELRRVQAELDAARELLVRIKAEHAALMAKTRELTAPVKAPAQAPAPEAEDWRQQAFDACLKANQTTAATEAGGTRAHATDNPAQ